MEILLTTLYLFNITLAFAFAFLRPHADDHPIYKKGKTTYKAIFPALPRVSVIPALVAALLFCAVVAQLEMAALSAALREAAFTPPVPSLEIAVRAATGMVRTDWSSTPSRTVAMLVVFRTEASVDDAAHSERRMIVEKDFMIATGS